MTEVGQPSGFQSSTARQRDALSEGMRSSSLRRTAFGSTGEEHLQGRKILGVVSCSIVAMRRRSSSWACITVCKRAELVR